MNRNLKLNVLGVMTGTSMDGVDISLINTNGTDFVKIICEKSYKFDKNYQNTINNLIINKPKNNNKIKKYFLKKDDFVTDILEKKIILFLKQKKINKKNIDLISISGQTVYHDPSNKISIQLGNGNKIAKNLKIKTISNLRDNDIKNGGQGAPIGSYYHKFLIQKFKKKVIIVNLGGIANFSTVVSKTLLSSDIGPANCLSDDLCNYFFKKKFDNDGNYARKGKIDNKLIEKFKKDKFFKKKFPKSLDRNYFRNYFNKLIKLNKYDALMTANYMTYIGFKELLKNKKFKIERILLTGGGRKNKLLKEILINKLNKKIELIDKYKINGDLVEAQMFAYIGMRSFKNLEISNKNTTGVKKNISGGILYFPD